MTLLSIKRPIFIRVVHYSSGENIKSSKFLEDLDRFRSKLDNVSGVGEPTRLRDRSVAESESRYRTVRWERGQKIELLAVVSPARNG
ncbi:MAG: hypothetical protein ACOCY1_02315, partial [Halovenus sp.]